MSFWLVPVVGVSGLLVCRAWMHDAALRSGELMDVRDVFPEGEADLELRALSGRRYRVELQFEAIVERAESDGSEGLTESPKVDLLPYHLQVARAEGTILFDRERALSGLFPLASHANESVRRFSPSEPQVRHWGCVPLLEFRTCSLSRLRFEFSIPLSHGPARIEKAQLILKEGVRRLRYSTRWLDRLSIDDPGYDPTR